MSDIDWDEKQQAVRKRFGVGKDASYRLLTAAEHARIGDGRPPPTTVEGYVQEVADLVEAHPRLLDDPLAGMHARTDPGKHTIFPTSISEEEAGFGFKLVTIPNPDPYSLPLGMPQPPSDIEIVACDLGDNLMAVKTTPASGAGVSYAIWDANRRKAPAVQAPASSIQELRERFGDTH